MLQLNGLRPWKILPRQFEKKTLAAEQERKRGCGDRIWQYKITAQQVEEAVHWRTIEQKGNRIRGKVMW